MIKSKHWKKDHGAVFEDENIYNQPPQISNLKLPIGMQAAASSSNDVNGQIQAQLDKVKELQHKQRLTS